MVVKVKRLSFESVRILYDGSIVNIEKEYEELVNLVSEYGGRVHGSQLNNDSDSYIIAVYFQIPLDAKEEFEKEYGH